jgi:hypothetical protein
MQRTISLLVLGTITGFTTAFSLPANTLFQSCYQHHCFVDRIPHFKRVLLHRHQSFAMNAQQEDSDNPEVLFPKEKSTSNPTGAQPNIKKVSTARVGGRVTSSSRSLADAQPSGAGDSGPISNSLGRLAIPLLLVWLFLQMLIGVIGGSNSSMSYSFYQSSVYESRTYTSDGKVETKRQESI